MKIGSFDNGQNELIWLMRNRPVAETANLAPAGAAAGAQATTPDQDQDDGSGSSFPSNGGLLRIRIDISSFVPDASSSDLAAAQSAWGQLQAGSGYAGSGATGAGGDTKSAGLAQTRGSDLQALRSAPDAAPDADSGAAKATLFL